MLKLNKAILQNNQSATIYAPKDRYQLQKLIELEMHKNGKNCSLNHIDVSNITNMNCLFKDSNFDGDISEWDVSNVEDMGFMFCNSKFTGMNGDISKWNISNVKVMDYMFYLSPFTCDISKWKINQAKTSILYMYEECALGTNNYLNFLPFFYFKY